MRGDITFMGVNRLIWFWRGLGEWQSNVRICRDFLYLILWEVELGLVWVLLFYRNFQPSTLVK